MTQIAYRRDRTKLQTSVKLKSIVAPFAEMHGIPFKIWKTFIKSCASHKPVPDAENSVVLYTATVATLEI